MNKLTILLFIASSIIANSNEENLANSYEEISKKTASLSESFSDEEISGNIIASTKTIFTESDTEYVKNAILENNPNLLESKEIENGSITITTDIDVKNFINNKTGSDVMRNFYFQIKGEGCRNFCDFDVEIFGNEELKDSSSLKEQVETCLEKLNELVI